MQIHKIEQCHILAQYHSMRPLCKGAPGYVLYVLDLNKMNTKTLCVQIAFNKKLCRCTETTRHATLENACNRGNDLQGHYSRSLRQLLLDGPYTKLSITSCQWPIVTKVLQRFTTAKVIFSLTWDIGNHVIRQAIHDFLLVFHCKLYLYLYPAPFLRYWLFPKYKEVTWTWPCSLEGLSIGRLMLHMANQCTKLEVSSLSHSSDTLGDK